MRDDRPISFQCKRSNRLHNASCWNPGPLSGSRFTPEEMKQIEVKGGH